jgi:hypothetical protein
MADVWFAKDVTIQVVDSDNVTVDTGTTLDAEFTAAAVYGVSVKNLQAYAKDVTITEPEGSIDKIDLLGVDANSFQNAQLDHKPYGLATITGTMLLDGDEVLEPYVAGTGTAITGSYTRYQVGRRITGNVANVMARKECSILVNLDDSTDEVNFALDNAWFTKLGDKKISGADGHWEQEFEIVCLPKDFYIEYKN